MGGATDEVARARRRRRWRRHGRGAPLPSDQGRLDRCGPGREGRAHLGLDLARGGADSPLHRQPQHGQGARLCIRAVSAAGSGNRPGDRLAWLRGDPPGDQPGRSRLVPLRPGRAALRRRRVPSDRPQRGRPSAPAARRRGHRARRLHAGRRPHRPRRQHHGHGRRCARRRRRDLSPQPGPRHRSPRRRGLGRGHRAGHHRRRARGQCRRRILAADRGDGRDRGPDRQHRPPVSGDREPRCGGGPRQGAAGGPRPAGLVLLPPGAAGADHRPLRDRRRPALGARRHRLVVRHRAAAARHRSPGAVAGARRQAHPGLRGRRHQAGRQRPHHAHAGRRLPDRSGAGPAQLLDVLRCRHRHHPGTRRGQVSGAMDGPRADRHQCARDGGEAVRVLVAGRLQRGQGGGRVPPDVPGALSRRVPRGGPAGEDDADLRQARGRRRRLRRDLRMGAGQVVRRRGRRRALRLSPHELVRAGGRGMPGRARARRRARPVELLQVRRQRPRRRRLSRPRHRQPRAAPRRPCGAGPRPDRARRHRERVHGDALRRAPLLPALWRGRPDPRPRLAGAAQGRGRGGSRSPT